MNTVLLLLNTLGLIFLIRYVLQQVREFRAVENKRGFFTFRRFRNSISLALIAGIPLILVNFILPVDLPEHLFELRSNPNVIYWIAVGMALLISGIWLMYVRRLDIYEPEKWIYLIATFLLACLSTRYLAIWMYQTLESFGIDLYGSNSVVYEFLYCVFVIGGIEEVSKILPVLVVLIIFRKAIDEPYDFILYGSVSALGFAFMENINYIYFSQLHNISGRALYAAVAHMTFSSIACYGIILFRYNLTEKNRYLLIPLFFLLAMAAHGFYDFWLINAFVVKYRAMTTVFFLVTIHLWVTMKNNALNISNFYTPEVELRNDRLRYYLIVSLASLLMLSYLIVASLEGRFFANRFLLEEILAYGYLIFYLAFGLSRYKIVQDRVNPLQVPFDFFVPMPRRSEEEP